MKLTTPKSELTIAGNGMLKIRPKAELSIQAELKRTYAEAVASQAYIDERDISRLKTIRASQLPFCPLQYLLNAARGGQYSPMGFHGNYFTKVGTAVHDVMQRFFGQTGRLLANWECPKCKKMRYLQHSAQCCGINSDYHEVTINHRYVVGHVDGIFKDAKGRYWVVDFKTTSSARAPMMVNDPGPAYKEQIYSYAFALREQYKLDIAGVALIFIIRDNPTEPVVYAEELDEEDHQLTKARLRRYTQQHKVAYNAATMSDLREVWKMRICKPHEVEAKAGYCLYKRGCAMGSPDEAKAFFRLGVNKKHIPIRVLVERLEKKC